MSAYDDAGRPEPVEIRLLSKEKALRISFADGADFLLGAELLRVESPSAEVQGHGPNTKVVVPGKRHVAITGVEPVGHYAVRLRFDDGHDSGLFSWEYLYNLGAGKERIWQDYLDALAARGLSR